MKGKGKSQGSQKLVAPNYKQPAGGGTTLLAQPKAMGGAFPKKGNKK